MKKFLLLLAIILVYFIYISWKFSFGVGFLLSSLTWSFFVLCTPVADAGFLLCFPIRILFKIRMLWTQISVWFFAIALNVVALMWKPEIYQKTALMSVFHKILVTPYPFWIIIVLCAIGTFLSVYFGDEVMDIISHKEHFRRRYRPIYKALAVGGLFILVFVSYHYLIKDIGIDNLL